ncbi:MAG: hypothetical protein AAF799_10760 [Myxococcota bacterium]
MKLQRLAWPAAVVAALLQTAACSVDDDPATMSAADTQASEQRAADALVVRVFDAFARKDCDALSRTLGESLRTPMSAKPCDEFLAHEPLTNAELKAVHRVEVDGRDPNAMLVTASIVQSGRERPIVIRVGREADALRVVAM